MFSTTYTIHDRDGSVIRETTDTAEAKVAAEWGLRVTAEVSRRQA